jgi:hypothetical protein
MKLKSICVLLVLACGSLLASPRKISCNQSGCEAEVIKVSTETAHNDETQFLPIQRFSNTVL